MSPSQTSVHLSSEVEGEGHTSDDVFERWKVRLVVQDQHMQRRMHLTRVILKTPLVLCLTAAVYVLSWHPPLIIICSRITLTLAGFCPGWPFAWWWPQWQGIHICPPQSTLRTPTFAICSANPCMTCPQQLGPYTLLWAPPSKHKVALKLTMKKAWLHPMTTKSCSECTLMISLFHVHIVLLLTFFVVTCRLTLLLRVTLTHLSG